MGLYTNLLQCWNSVWLEFLKILYMYPHSLWIHTYSFPEWLIFCPSSRCFLLYVFGVRANYMTVSSAFIPCFPPQKSLTLSACGYSSAFTQKTIWWLCLGKEKTGVNPEHSLGFVTPTGHSPENSVNVWVLKTQALGDGSIAPWFQVPSTHRKARSPSVWVRYSSLVGQFSWIQELQVQQESQKTRWTVIKEDAWLNVYLWFSHVHIYPHKHGYYTPPWDTPQSIPYSSGLFFFLIF